MHRFKMLAAMFVLCCLPVTALAVSPLYSYVEGGFVQADPDGAGSMNGFSLGGSFAFNEQFHGIVEYADVSDSPLDFSQTRLAVGYSYPVTSGSDLVVRAGYVHENVDIGVLDASDNGWMAQVGVRSMVTDVFELDGFLTHLNASSSDTGIGLAGRYYFSYSLSVGADVEFFDDFTRYRALVRYSF